MTDSNHSLLEVGHWLSLERGLDFCSDCGARSRNDCDFVLPILLARQITSDMKLPPNLALDRMTRSAISLRFQLGVTGALLVIGQLIVRNDTLSSFHSRIASARFLWLSVAGFAQPIVLHTT